MFTGIVEEIGTVKNIKRGTSSASLLVLAEKVLDGTKIGDSISVNGVCLTVTSLDNQSFCADVMEETMRRSSLCSLTAGAKVNLERAMPADGRFGGHIVSGHIDGTGTIKNIRKEEMAVWYDIESDSSLLKYIVKKGSVAIDGISLTVADETADHFSVSIIPHTMGNTILSEKKIGDVVNIETDIIGKYVEKMVAPQTESRLSNYEDATEFLAENGF
ncbi:MAG: riboflavin synthase [Eubacterium sp.]|nr:riboflavin synthase [Eubacterium sp.]